MTPPNDPISVAVVGLGFGANHARILANMPQVRLAGVCDPDEGRLAEVSAGRQVPSYRDLDDLLCQEKPDAVIVAVPPRLHEEVALAALQAGCAVMVEKPLAPNLEAARRMAEAAAARGLTLMPGHIERFNPALRELLRRVRAGEIGRVLQINARRLAYFIPRPRAFDVGVVQDLAYHDIDITRLVAGAEVDQVYAETRAGLRTPYEDALSALLRFHGERNKGAIASLEVNWLSTRKVRELSVLGEAGLLVASYADFATASLEFQPAQRLEQARPARPYEAAVALRGAEPGPARALPLQPVEPLALELQAFVSCLREGTPPPVSVEDALATLAICDALIESGASGQPMTPRPIT